ncbi:hypothetical protein [Rhodococcus sp. NPDC059234]|uniref:hypothetical protein n=1 Tax=Rhodococcus sp. NPDC059234 TaxID=3346781 RepID=UPI0036722CB8
MGIAIKSTGVSVPAVTTSIIEHSARAARAAMAAAGIEAQQVGVLVNTGIYRDSNLFEPSIAALIQREAGIGLEYPDGVARSFSFDLMNGACGVLNAVQVATALLETDSAEHVLVVSGDTHPSLQRRRPAADFPFVTAGAALLLEKTDGPEGFGPVAVAESEGSPATEGFADMSTMGVHGRSLVHVVREEGFEQRLLEVATSAATSAMGADTDPRRTALICSRPTEGFGALLAGRLGLPGDSVIGSGEVQGDAHTAALTVAYHHAAEDALLAGYDRVLFVAAGAGPSAAAVVYRLAPPQ